MSGPRVAALVLLAAAPVALVAVAACGSRTGLPMDDVPVAITPPVDAASRDATTDGPPVRPRDAAPDALPPIDASRRDATRDDCPDAAATLVYVMTTQNDLYSFHPPTGVFRLIGRIACPSASTAQPFSMAVNRAGTAYVLFNDGTLFRVSTSNAACTATAFEPNQRGFDLFGMGYAADDVGSGETLYVAQNPGGRSGTGGASLGLARIDTTTFRLGLVGTFDRPVGRVEMTGTGDGRLFAYYLDETNTRSAVAEFDKSSARVIAASPVPLTGDVYAFAFAAWGGDFYIFSAASPGGASAVRRFRAVDNSITQIGTLAATIVGAGVSTCAPQ